MSRNRWVSSVKPPNGKLHLRAAGCRWPFPGGTGLKRHRPPKSPRFERVSCTLCVRAVRPQLSERIGAGRRKLFDFRNCISMQVMILCKRYLINPCLPSERETAPSLGVRLVNAGRKQEEKPGKSNRTTGLARKATMDKVIEGALRCCHARTSQPLLRIKAG
jgi:hypothetical protein